VEAVTEFSAVTSAVVRTSAHTTAGCANIRQCTRASTWLDPDSGLVRHPSCFLLLDPDSGVVEDCAVTALRIFDEAFADLLDSLLDTAGRALDLDDALGGLGQHLLLECRVKHHPEPLEYL
jgi:hypothetical protein